ncbi:MAG: hypothetical protein PHU46_12240 [Rhodocyclaceae bacterium]|nr:hypothetical protein [Rhodocyclaceae bacterium]
MADRSMSAEAIAEVMKSNHAPVFLVTVYFDDQTIALCDGWRTVVWGGLSYTAQGYFMGFSGLEETADPTIPNVTITLSAVDQFWIAIALSKPYLDRRITIHKAFLDYSESVITSPVMIFDGRLDGLDIADDPGAGTCNLQASASSQWADFTRTPGRHTNAAEQQVWFPGDKGLDYAAATNVAIKWGAT